MSHFDEIFKLKEDTLREMFPYVHFGKRCFAYCGEMCDCDARISPASHTEALKEAKKRLENNDE